jgi:hypothetical protein
MALPPEPIDEVLPEAATAVLGEITAIVAEGTQAPFPKIEEGMSDAPGVPVASQTVSLRVDKVLFGAAEVGELVEVLKPAGDYKLVIGNKGPFLLGAPSAGEKRPTILGRYGPDTYPESLIEAAAKRLGR